jgi:2-polyprenyl-3-methyl-5-hydroxy-6-metoxy-1,4-benzoquinol methylase
MFLPTEEQCKTHPFLNNLRNEDERGFFSKKRGSNQSFLMRRRYLLSHELLKGICPKNNPEFNIADFACGSGNVGLLLAEDGYNVDFIDNEKLFFDYIKLKSDKKNVQFHLGDCSTYQGSKKYDAIYFGEAIEHMANPAKTIINLRENLKTGGYLCLTTPNGDFINCYEPSWTEVKDQPERNEKLANTIGNHVCEFTRRELKDLLKENGFNIIHHFTFLSDQISRKSLLRRVLPEPLLWKLDLNYSKKSEGNKNFGRTQIILAQRAH